MEAQDSDQTLHPVLRGDVSGYAATSFLSKTGLGRVLSNGKASLDKLKGDEEKLEEVIKRVKNS